MRTRIVCALALAAAVVLGAGRPARAQAPDPTVTRIVVPDMHCGGCAKRVEARLREVPGVARLQSNVQAKTVWIVPRPQTVLSPRLLWEAVERAGKHPDRLEGPSGVFTARPQS